MTEPKIIPTWGYSRTESRIFNLAEGQGLPEGFYSHPDKIPKQQNETKVKAAR